ncbi:GNAT family N-acetyltransferase [Lederbergia galactosidilytica]|uniref:GNAT family acetyltransferase n=1 Tax=Lederbergia galactosidilytica TaxID=217031 RepID=A0A0Q9Y7U0_9BACI|nr:GNAT family N-acetyltransferase [Lederbergia galactosidilytica]KRG11077.1 GNAT family acetyltransferase [Virgibacillus soli]KRG11784.1 GNAT family acetyltransferase [Lederbergia galactosidilytica]MBP1916559.1 ribosomal protein S18 acetylase RimI-like enzyme [Lederbergia galactosidilytica]OAK71974.1 GNAT family acetyltransferase [Lederbergia galactosidilytica]
MDFRKTTEEDIDQIMAIIKQAQQYFKDNHIDQWQNNYPNVQTIKKDMQNGYSYVLVNERNIIATAAISFDGEKTYNQIYGGKWLSDEKYAVIHRLAVDPQHKGLGISSEVLKNVEKMCTDQGVNSIKIDTHAQNSSMQRLLQKNNFTYCGVIYLGNGSKRIAFEKLMTDL